MFVRYHMMLMIYASPFPIFVRLGLHHVNLDRVMLTPCYYSHLHNAVPSVQDHYWSVIVTLCRSFTLFGHIGVVLGAVFVACKRWRFSHHLAPLSDSSSRTAPSSTRGSLSRMLMERLCWKSRDHVGPADGVILNSRYQYYDGYCDLHFFVLLSLCQHETEFILYNVDSFCWWHSGGR